MEPTAASSLRAGPSLARRLIVGRNPRFTVVRAVTLILVSFITFTFILKPIRVTGISMEPSYRNNRINFINRLAYLRHGPQRGDVIGIRFSPPSRLRQKSPVLLKRVVGLPGERIGFERGRITVNGQLLDEPYLKFPSDWNAEPVEVGPDQYFVVGDNRSMPKHLHDHGRADRERILGKTLL